MAYTGKPKSVKMAKVQAPQMKMPKTVMGSRPSKAHPWDGGAPTSGKMPGGKPC